MLAPPRAPLCGYCNTGSLELRLAHNRSEAGNLAGVFDVYANNLAAGIVVKYDTRYDFARVESWPF